MKRILIIDDEAHLCWLIQKFITDEYQDQFQILQSYDGLDAFQKIQDYRPDLVISDVRIPGHDGIELVKLTHEIGLTIPFIIISGYRQFEYAHNAIKYGVIDYLLKPINHQELISSISKVLSDYEIHQKTEEIQLKDHVYKLKIRTLALEQLLKNAASQVTDLNQFNEQNCFHFAENGLFYAITVKMKQTSSRSDMPPYPDAFITDFRTLIYRNFSGSYTDFELLTNKGELTIIMNRPAAGNKSKDKKEIYYLFQSLTSLTSQSGHQVFSFGLGIPVSSLNELPQTVASSREACQVFITKGFGQLYDAQMLSYTGQRSLSPEEKDQLMRCFELSDEQGIMRIIDTLFSDMNQNASLHPKYYFSVADEITRTISQFAASFPDFNILPLILDTDLAWADSVPKLTSLLKSRVSGYLEEIQKQKEAIEKTPIRIAQKYIAEHLSDTIALANVAELVYLNPVYFSVLFKKETKQNFSSYITAMRINKAKDLLTQSNDSVQRIAELVGYMDAQTFSKRFRKETGILPRDYRRFHRNHRTT